MKDLFTSLSDISNTIFKKWLPLELATHIRINQKYFVIVEENLTFFQHFQLYVFNMSEHIKHITVKKLPIRLGQFLKLADLVQDGVEAKIRIKEGEVLVNKTVETRRGRQLKEGDTVSFDGKTRLVTLPS